MSKMLLAVWLLGASWAYADFDLEKCAAEVTFKKSQDELVRLLARMRDPVTTLLIEDSMATHTTDSILTALRQAAAANHYQPTYELSSRQLRTVAHFIEKGFGSSHSPVAPEVTYPIYEASNLKHREELYARMDSDSRDPSTPWQLYRERLRTTEMMLARSEDRAKFWEFGALPVSSRDGIPHRVFFTPGREVDSGYRLVESVWEAKHRLFYRVAQEIEFHLIPAAYLSRYGENKGYGELLNLIFASLPQEGNLRVLVLVDIGVSEGGSKVLLSEMEKDFIVGHIIRMYGRYPGLRGLARLDVSHLNLSTRHYDWLVEARVPVGP